MVDKIALIFGYGPNVGFSTAEAFQTKGYKLAVVSRSTVPMDGGKDYLYIRADLSDPSSVEKIFSQVRKELGHPSIVIYNGISTHLERCSMTANRLPASAGATTSSTSISQQIATFQSDNNINLVSAYVAAMLAAESFALLPPESSKTFIYTGNKLPFMIVLPLLTQGVGKAGAAHLIHYLAEEHKERGYK